MSRPPDVEKMEAKGDIKGLERALTYKKDAHIRKSAAASLGRLKSVESLRPLAYALFYDDGLVREAAIEALVKIGDARAVGPLIAVLKDWRVRTMAASALGELGDPRAVEPLIAVLKEGEGDSRLAAAAALGQLGDARAVEPLIAALRHRASEVRKAATEALDGVGWKPESDEQKAWYWMAKREWSQCVALGPSGVEPLIAALKDLSNKERKNAAWALGELGDPRGVEPLMAAFEELLSGAPIYAAEALVKLGDTRAVEPLIVALNRGWKEQAKVAAWALGMLGDLRAVESLIAALKSRDWEVRNNAAEALGKLGDARAVEPLIAALKDENSIVQKLAAELLGMLGDARAVEPLIAILKDGDSDVRKGAARALGELGDARAIEPLIAILKDWQMSDSAAEGLVKIGTPAVEPLIAALNDGDRQMRERVAGVLDRLGWRPGPDENGARYWIAKRQLDKCIEIGSLAVEPLIAPLKHGDRDVRWEAAKVLGQIGDAAAMDALIAALEDGWVREGAARALGEIGASAIEPLSAALKDQDRGLRKAATEVLDGVGWKPESDEQKAWYWMAKQEWSQCVALGPSGVEPLIAVLNDRDSHMRNSAVKALGEIGDGRAVEPLIVALKDSDAVVRYAAAVVLGELGDARAIASFIVALQDHAFEVRYEAAKALVEFYRKGMLKDQDKQATLSQREYMTQSHSDSTAHSDTPGNDLCQIEPHSDLSHTDSGGIGIEFPL
jgi:HEAT repeat protein